MAKQLCCFAAPQSGAAKSFAAFRHPIIVITIAPQMEVAGLETFSETCYHSFSYDPFCINWAFEQCGHLRIDTHGDNIVMQRLVKKLGFVHCGTIHVEEDDYPRLAFEKISVGRNG